MPARANNSEPKVTRGRPVSGFPGSLWNTLVDAVKRHKRERFRTGPRHALTNSIVPANTILINNTVGDQSRSFSVFQIDTAVLTPESTGENMNERIAFDGIAPQSNGSATADGPIAIMLGPSRENEIGTAVIAGITCVWVLFAEDTDEWANPIPSITSHMTTSATSGAARILWSGDADNPPVEGAKLALVHLTGASHPDFNFGNGCDGEGWGWVAGLLTTDCLEMDVLAAVGYCFGIDTTQSGYMRWDSGASKWVLKEWNGSAWVNKNFTHDHGSGTLSFWIDSGRPRLQIGTVTYDLVLKCGGAGVVVFAGGSATVCDGSAVSGCVNSFEIRLRCSCCPIDGWDGPGWYCIEDTGPEDCIVAELLDEDKCDTEITICSGPYASEADAIAVCGSGTITGVTGCSNPQNKQLKLTFGGGVTADDQVMNGTVVYLGNAGGNVWSNSNVTLPTPSEGNIAGHVFSVTRLDANNWELRVVDPGGGYGGLVNAAETGCVDAAPIVYSGIVWSDIPSGTFSSIEATLEEV